MFVDDPTVLAAVADELKVSQSTLPPQVPGIVHRAHIRAYNLIVRILSKKGFTSDQIVLWDEGASFETSLAVWFTLTDDNVLHVIGVDEKFAFSFDRTKELEALQVFVAGGIAVYPKGPYGLPHVGHLDTQDDIFAGPPAQVEPDDNELGRPTRW